MTFGATFFVVAALVVAIWVVLELKRLKHKILAIVLIGLVIFTYVGFSISVKNQDIDLKTPSGMLQAGKLYFSWLGEMFTNFKSITAYALKQDWSSPDINETKTKDKKDLEIPENIWDKI